ncbi:glycosyltransferase [Roseospirillum parvum]|uniref:Glycosyl transferases group 1 n=1 Tax=Roseospirillum parvum TaxID=83401 RepID=A0A1G7U2K9_9PROT|nr:glycosyltransferase [Roseospirillum parvum]SDG41289.1 hypothetical protein SAMN05421742_101171 [Roseospirillum parvum]
MRILLLDDSFPFDGYSPQTRPLGGPEKAFARLPGALVGLGHQVSVYNRSERRLFIEGARWRPLGAEPLPFETDLLIAHRTPALLEKVRGARARLLWVTGDPAPLGGPEARRRLADVGAVVALAGPAQEARWRGEVPMRRLPLGVGGDYLASGRYFLDDPKPAEGPPRAIVTTHPAHGLAGILEMWAEVIHPRVPAAELHVYSATLAKVAEGAEPPPELREVAARALAMGGVGVRLLKPQGDPVMARAYREADVHLYPGHAGDLMAWTLAESQAAGAAAVVGPQAAAVGRIDNGETGHVAPDDAGFANLAAQMLADRGWAARLGAAAADPARHLTWRASAEGFAELGERLLAPQGAARPKVSRRFGLPRRERP